MSTIKASDLIALFQRMYNEHWAYVYGSAKEGCVDCSGALVYAYSQLGGGAIEHGSNAIARNRTDYLTTIDHAAPGYAAFKARAYDPEQCSAKYNDQYGDLYHVGVVDSTGQYVLNAKGTNSGFSRDPLSAWDCVAPLKAVEYSNVTQEEETMAALYQATVTTSKDPLRVRDYPETGRILTHIPKDRIVDVLTDGNWPRIRYGDTVGYVSAAYLTRCASAPIAEPTPDSDPTQPTDTATTLTRDDGITITLCGKWSVMHND